MKKRILVISSANMDLVLNIVRIPAPGETLLSQKNYAFMPGGKGANAAVCAARLGADSMFATRLGSDNNGVLLKKFYENNKINTRFIKNVPSCSTGLATIMVDENGENRIIVYPGANAYICDDDVEEAFMCYPDALYVNFEIPFETVVTACNYAKKQGVPVIIDAGPISDDIKLELLPDVEIFSPNEHETYALTGIMPTNMDACLRAASVLFKKMHVKYIVIKLGERGCFVYDGIHYNVCAPYETSVVDTTGAGDAFTAALAIEYLRGENIISACNYANAVGAIAVSREGACVSYVSDEDVRKFIKENEVI